MNVLIIEDSKTIATMIALNLEMFGQEILTSVVANLFDALEVLRQQKTDVVLLDLCLSDSKAMEGLTIIRRRFPTVAVIILTDDINIETEKQAFKCGAQDFMRKDHINSKQLGDMINHAIWRRAAIVEEVIALSSNTIRSNGDEARSIEKLWLEAK